MYNPHPNKCRLVSWCSFMLIILLAACQPIQRPADETVTDPASTERYQDPQGFFSVPIPTNWSASEGVGFTLLTDPENKAKVYLLTVPTAEGDLATALAAGWAKVDPTFALSPAESHEPPATDGVEKVLVTTYDAPKTRIVQGGALLYQERAYLLLFDCDLEVIQKRGAQLAIIQSGFDILARKKADLSRVQPLQINNEIRLTLAQFIETWRGKFQIPGAAVAIVQNGKVVYRQGFGVRNPAGDPLTPETYMMIGSTGKGLTTLMMATLVDDGKMSWETPAQTIYPQFAVKEPALSKAITMRNLVCACTGVPRRDYEFAFNARALNAEDTVASLREFEFYTGFGEAFQYSNQMVATGGYLAAVADGGPQNDLLTGYARSLQRRVLEPLGMTRTTVSFDTVLADDNYAIPYAYNYLNDYVALPPEMEKVLLPVTPAGAHWSTLDDMTQYLLLQLRDGVTPDGKRLVSLKNLAEVRKPQIKVTEQMSYGLGWGISEYKGQPVIEHSGNTLGFTSEFKFLPQAQLGIIVLTNAQGTNVFSGGVSERLLELVFQQAAEIEKKLAFTQQQYVEEGKSYQSQVDTTVDDSAVAPYLGLYRNDDLGELNITFAAGQLRADVGEFASPLLPKNDDKGHFEGYMFTDPPMTGMVLTFAHDTDGQPIITMGEGVDEYTFRRLE